MTTVTLEVRPLATALADFERRWQDGKAEAEGRIGFDSPELLWKVMTAKRWDLLKGLAEAGPVTMRGAAKLVGRDAKAVHADIAALLTAGILRRAESGRGVVFPYDAIHVDFTLKAA